MPAIAAQISLCRGAHRLRGCQRDGSYRLARLAAKYGPEIGLEDLLERLTAIAPGATLGTHSNRMRAPATSIRRGDREHACPKTLGTARWQEMRGLALDPPLPDGEEQWE